MNSKGIEIAIKSQLEKLRRAIAVQEAQANREMEAKLSEMVKD
jgi:hypothetical protein